MTPRSLALSAAVVCGAYVTGGQVNGLAAQLPAGSVARAAYDHNLTLAEVQRWWPVFRPLLLRAETDSAVRRRLKFPFRESLETQVQLVDSAPEIVVSLRKAHMASRDFVLITRIVIDAIMTPPQGLPMTVNPANALFFKQHKATIDSLLVLQ